MPKHFEKHCMFERISTWAQSQTQVPPQLSHKIASCLQSKTTTCWWKWPAGQTWPAEQFEVTNIAPEGHFWPETIRSWLWTNAFPKDDFWDFQKKLPNCQVGLWSFDSFGLAPTPKLISLVARSSWSNRCFTVHLNWRSPRNGEGLFDEVHPSLLHEDDQN